MNLSIRSLPLILFWASMTQLNVSACEKPSFDLPPEVIEIATGTFAIDWSAVPNAQLYEVKYSMRVPEGRTFIQRELTVDKPTFRFPESELAQSEAVQIIVNIMAHCALSKSEPKNVLIALRNTNVGCRFEKELPSLVEGMLILPASVNVQSYLVCAYQEEAATSCKEISQLERSYAVKGATYLGVTPVCKNSTGKPFYVSKLNK